MATKRNARPWRNVLGGRAMTARVLVVDDEPDAEPLFRQQFRREVREGLCRLDFARSGETALHMLDGPAGDKIILLLLDIVMPGMADLIFWQRSRDANAAADLRHLGLW